MKFFASDDESELDILATRNAGIGKVVEMLKYLSEEESLCSFEMSREKRLRYVEGLMADERNQTFCEVFFDALLQGWSDGLAEGEARGCAEGEVRGHYEGTIRVARAALSEGASVDFIERITGLDAEAIRHLQKN